MQQDKGVYWLKCVNSVMLKWKQVHLACVVWGRVQYGGVSAALDMRK